MPWPLEAHTVHGLTYKQVSTDEEELERHTHTEETLTFPGMWGGSAKAVISRWSLWVKKWSSKQKVKIRH
jgi:hypothetical protein